MVICVCNNVSDKDVRCRLDAGSSVEELLECGYVGNRCGCCIEHVEDRFKQESEKCLIVSQQ